MNTRNTNNDITTPSKIQSQNAGTDINSSIFDIIIIGAGAAGLFAAANIDASGKKALILDKAKKPGLKLLMSGAGQCNVTHAGDPRDFIEHYGPAGKKIRPVIYSLSSDDLCDWFSSNGLPLYDRGDGKIFPETMSAASVLNVLKNKATANGFTLKSNSVLSEITIINTKDINLEDVAHIKNTPSQDATYTDSHLTRTNSYKLSTSDGTTAPLQNVYKLSTSDDTTYLTKKLIIATGGCSYPTTGSDGSAFPVLEVLGHTVITPKPSLVPLSVEGYPYTDLSGIAVKKALVTIYDGPQKTKKSPHMYGDVLFTHKNLSGPGILDMSRYANNGNKLEINWIPDLPAEKLLTQINSLRTGSKKLLSTVLEDILCPTLTGAHLRVLRTRAQIPDDKRLADLSSKELKTLIGLLTADTFTISGNAGYSTAMCTSGGVSLAEVDMKSMESKTHPGLYFIGECLDVDGDTGGYNIHFAFASALTAAKAIDL